MKTIILIFLLTVASIVRGQRSCQILSDVFKEKKIRAAFGLEMYHDSVIRVIDTGKYFIGCQNIKINKRNIIISQDTALLTSTNTSDIIVHSLTQGRNRNKFRMLIAYKRYNSFGYLDLKKRRGKYVVVRNRIGVY